MVQSLLRQNLLMVSVFDNSVGISLICVSFSALLIEILASVVTVALLSVIFATVATTAASASTSSSTLELVVFVLGIYAVW